MRTLRRRLAGFTLTELLVALLITVMLTGMVATGVNIGNKLYRQSKFQSQSETLLGTIDSALRTPFQTLELSEFSTGNYIATCRAGEDSTKVYGKVDFANAANSEIKVITEEKDEHDKVVFTGLAVEGYERDYADADKPAGKKRNIELLNKSAFQSMKVTITPSYELDATTGVVTTTVHVHITDKTGEQSVDRQLIYKSSKVRTIQQAATP